MFANFNVRVTCVGSILHKYLRYDYYTYITCLKMSYSKTILPSHLCNLYFILICSIFIKALNAAAYS